MEGNATVAEQEYLEIMFWLEEAGLPMTGANIARAMQLSPPTVHEMIGRLVEDGYVSRSADKSLAFTGSGGGHATPLGQRRRAGADPDRDDVELLERKPRRERRPDHRRGSTSSPSRRRPSTAATS